MNVLDYLQDRDTFIATEIYAVFRDKLLPDYEEQCYEMALQAVQQAVEKWLRDTDAHNTAVLADTLLSPPGEIDGAL